MYSNNDVKFPVKKKPANNEPFDKGFTKPSNTNKRKKKKSKK